MPERYATQILTSRTASMATVESSSAHAAAAGALPTFTIESSKRQLVGRIGPWQLVRLLSDGELARVYAARPAEAPQESPAGYVLKVLRKEWWRDPNAIDMQRRAAWVGRKVSHPHLMPVLFAGVEQPPFYVVSPKLEGQTLTRLLEHERHMPLALTLWVARQVAEALDALHTTVRMVHSDVKPANIIVGPDGHATLIDLGFVHAPDEGRHWSMRPVYGTLNYLAPEALTSALGASPQSDLYSLGATLYEMLSGGVPFVGRDAEHLIRQHRESKPQCIRLRRPDTPKAVASLVHRLLAKDPLRRPESAAAVAAELVRLEIECFAAR
jgi:serine/threonine-protein kinase